MRTAGRIKAAAALVLAAAILAGCGGPRVSPEARELLEAARGHASDSAESLEAVEVARKRFLEMVSAQAVPGVEALEGAALLLDSAERSEEKALSELKQMESVLSRLRGMEPGEELGRYVEMKLEAVREQEKFIETELEAMALRKRIITESGSGASLEQLFDLRSRTAGLEESAEEHAVRARALHEDAEDFFEEKKLE